MQFERSLNKVGENSLTLTLPVDLIKFLGLTKESIIILDESNGVVTLKKKE